MGIRKHKNVNLNLFAFLFGLISARFASIHLISVAFEICEKWKKEKHRKRTPHQFCGPHTVFDALERKGNRAKWKTIVDYIFNCQENKVKNALKRILFSFFPITLVRSFARSLSFGALPSAPKTKPYTIATHAWTFKCIFSWSSRKAIILKREKKIDGDEELDKESKINSIINR